MNVRYMDFQGHSVPISDETWNKISKYSNLEIVKIVTNVDETGETITFTFMNDEGTAVGEVQVYQDYIEEDPIEFMDDWNHPAGETVMYLVCGTTVAILVFVIVSGFFG